MIGKQAPFGDHVTYHVYENWTVQKARVHLSHCSHCRHGRGRRKARPDSGRNGQWHGPFGSLEAASQCARETGRPVSFCKHCLPQGNPPRLSSP